MKMDKRQHTFSYSAFLNSKDRSFILWRLTRTPEQDEYWQNYIRSHPEEQQEFDEAIAACDQIRINERTFADTDVLYRSICEHLAAADRRRRRLRIYYLAGVAACLVVLLSATLYLYFAHDRSLNPVRDEIVGQIQPDEDILLIAGNKTVQLQENTQLQLSNGRITCTDSARKASRMVIAGGKTNRIVVPYGKRTFVTLADGSRVWINSGTEIEFPGTFAGGERHIRVDGEIYIDVARSARHPFIVHTPKLDVTVHGTCFNLSAYAGEGNSSVVLVRGKVSVRAANGSSVEMKPNEMASLNGGRLAKQHVAPELYTSWVNGIFIFDNTPIAQVLNRVSKYYNVSFDARTAALSGKHVTGKLLLSGNIDDVLTSISLLTSTRYTRSGNTVRLTDKQ